MDLRDWWIAMLPYRKSWIARAFGRIFSVFGQKADASFEDISDLTEPAQLQPIQTSIEAVARRAQACGDGCGGGDHEGSCVGCNSATSDSEPLDLDQAAPIQHPQSASDALIGPVSIFADIPKQLTLTVSVKAATGEEKQEPQSVVRAPEKSRTSDLALRLEIISKMNVPVARKRKPVARVAPAGKAIPVRMQKQRRVVRSTTTPVWPAYKGRSRNTSADLRTKPSGQIIALPVDTLGEKVARELEHAA